MLDRVALLLVTLVKDLSDLDFLLANRVQRLVDLHHLFIDLSQTLFHFILLRVVVRLGLVEHIFGI